MEVREFRAHLWQYETLERLQKMDIARLKAFPQRNNGVSINTLKENIRSREISLRALRKRLTESF